MVLLVQHIYVLCECVLSDVLHKERETGKDSLFFCFRLLKVQKPVFQKGKLLLKIFHVLQNLIASSFVFDFSPLCLELLHELKNVKKSCPMLLFQHVFNIRKKCTRYVQVHQTSKAIISAIT